MTDGMTAADTLRALADDWNDRCCGLYVHLRDGAEERWGVDSMHYGSVAAVLREIADAAEEEQKALRAFAERVHGMLWGDGWHPLDEIADRLDEELDDLEVMRSVGSEADGLVRDHDGLDAVRARMLPAGFEWPRFEDGEPVAIGDCFATKRGETDRICQVLFGRCFYSLCGEVSEYGWLYGERVKLPAPKVYDADGVEIKVGDEVWSISGDGPMSVEEIRPSDDPDDPEHLVWCGDKGCELLSDVKIWRIADQLTHQRPDTWERIEQDARSMLDDGLHPNDEWVLDLLSRAKALAERGA